MKTKFLTFLLALSCLSVFGGAGGVAVRRDANLSDIANSGTARTNLSAHNAANLTSGTLADARLGTNLPVMVNYALPAVGGNLLSNLNASAIASGTLDDARLSSANTMDTELNSASNILWLTVATNAFPTTNASLLTTGTLANARLTSVLQSVAMNNANTLSNLPQSGVSELVNSLTYFTNRVGADGAKIAFIGDSLTDSRPGIGVSWWPTNLMQYPYFCSWGYTNTAVNGQTTTDGINQILSITNWLQKTRPSDQTYCWVDLGSNDTNYSIAVSNLSVIYHHITNANATPIMATTWKWYAINPGLNNWIRSNYLGYGGILVDKNLWGRNELLYDGVHPNNAGNYWWAFNVGNAIRQHNQLVSTYAAGTNEVYMGSSNGTNSFQLGAGGKTNLTLKADGTIQFNGTCDGLTLAPLSYLTFGTFNQVIDNGSALAFYTYAGRRIEFYPSGNLGIGRTAPAAKLDVNGTVLATTFAGNGTGLSNAINPSASGGIEITWDGYNLGISGTNAAGGTATNVYVIDSSVQNNITTNGDAIFTLTDAYVPQPSDATLSNLVNAAALSVYVNAANGLTALRTASGYEPIHLGIGTINTNSIFAYSGAIYQRGGVNGHVWQNSAGNENLMTLSDAGVLNPKYLQVSNLLGSVAFAAGVGSPMQHSYAEKPDKYYNTWFELSYHTNLTSSNIIAAALTYKTNGLLAAGYDLIQIDDGWQTDALDAQGNWVVDTNYIPNITNLVTALKTNGFRVGIYACGYSGPTIGNNTPAMGDPADIYAQAEIFASWGIDNIKLDYVSGANEGQPALAKLWSDAIARTGRKMTLLCTDEAWSASANAGDYDLYAEDFSFHPYVNWLENATGPGYTYPAAYTNLHNYATNVLYQRMGYDGTAPGFAFELAIFSTDLKTNQTKYHLVWDALFQSPLQMHQTVQYATNLIYLTNAAVLAVNNDPGWATPTMHWTANGAQSVWVKKLGFSGVTNAVAIWNWTNATAALNLSATNFGFAVGSVFTLKDVWTGTETTYNGSTSGLTIGEQECLFYIATGPRSGWYHGQFVGDGSRITNLASGTGLLSVTPNAPNTVVDAMSELEAIVGSIVTPAEIDTSAEIFGITTDESGTDGVLPRFKLTSLATNELIKWDGANWVNTSVAGVDTAAGTNGIQVLTNGNLRTISDTGNKDWLSIAAMEAINLTVRTNFYTGQTNAASLATDSNGKIIVGAWTGGTTNVVNDGTTVSVTDTIGNQRFLSTSGGTRVQTAAGTPVLYAESSATNMLGLDAPVGPTYMRLVGSVGEIVLNATNKVTVTGNLVAGGNINAATPAAEDNSTNMATTAFVQTELGNMTSLVITTNGLGTTILPTLVLTNGALAVTNTQQASPALMLAGGGMRTQYGTNVPVSMGLYTLPVQGGNVNPSAQLTVVSGIGGATPTTTGTYFRSDGTVIIGGTCLAASHIAAGATSGFGWGTKSQIYSTLDRRVALVGDNNVDFDLLTLWGGSTAGTQWNTTNGPALRVINPTNRITLGFMRGTNTPTAATLTNNVIDILSGGHEIGTNMSPPTAASTYGGMYLWNSNGTGLYLIKSGPNSTTWTSTNVLSGP